MLDKKGFDLWADGYDKSVGLSDEANTYPFAGYKDVLSTIYEEILTNEMKNVLDIGFGTGTLTTKLYDQGCHIWGVDFSERMIALAREKMPDAVLVQGDFAEGLPEKLTEQKYDAIVATYSLHHLTDERKITFLSELQQYLAENGRIYIGDVAFGDRQELEACHRISADEWDEDEIYFVYEEFQKQFPGKVKFRKMSDCAGVLMIEKNN